MLVLPNDLHAAITKVLATEHPSRWISAAQELSERYRTPERGRAVPITNRVQALGYAALILPATYAQLDGALSAAAARVPAWQPQTLLDLGSGPGTALWAASARWPSLRSARAVEQAAPLLALGRELAAGSSTTTVANARWDQSDLRRLSGRGERYDLVILGHVLNELTPDEQHELVTTAWALTAGMLVIVEPGTPADFEVVRRARDQLLEAEAQTIAPCAHDRPCPLADDWCHFPQRLKRPEFQRRARGAPSEWEDAKFAYAAMARFVPEIPIWGRVIREPVWNKAYADAPISTADGVRAYRGLKRHREAFRFVKELAWGAALSEPPPEPIAPGKDSQ